MTVKELIEELERYPLDMPVAINGDISPETVDNPYWIRVIKHTWVHGNWPFNKTDFEYINLE